MDDAGVTTDKSCLPLIFSNQSNSFPKKHGQGPLYFIAKGQVPTTSLKDSKESR